MDKLDFLSLEQLHELEAVANAEILKTVHNFNKDLDTFFYFGLLGGLKKVICEAKKERGVTA